MNVNNKSIKFVATAGVSEKYAPLEMASNIRIALSVLIKYPVDMLIFEMVTPETLQIRLAGYDFNTGVLDEKTVAYTTKSLPIEKFWLKIDDYGDHYVGTFLFPDEY